MKNKSMKKRSILPLSLLAFLAIFLACIHVGCSGNSGDSIIRSVSIRVSGFYTGNPISNPLVRQNTGNPISNMNIIQTGDNLEAVDNNGNIFRGTISQEDGTIATFMLNGMTTAGAQGTIAGTFTISGTTSTMEGTWTEPALFSPVFGTATVPTNAVVTVTTNATVSSLNIVPSFATLSDTTNSITFTASSGVPPYSWSLSSSSLGAFLLITGTDNELSTYSASVTGTSASNTIILTDSANTVVNAIVSQTPQSKAA